MSICNLLDYHRPECLYIHDLGRLEAPYLSISALSCRLQFNSRYLGVSPPEFNLI